MEKKWDRRTIQLKLLSNSRGIWLVVNSRMLYPPKSYRALCRVQRKLSLPVITVIWSTLYLRVVFSVLRIEESVYAHRGFSFMIITREALRPTMSTYVNQRTSNASDSGIQYMPDNMEDLASGAGNHNIMEIEEKLWENMCTHNIYYKYKSIIFLGRYVDLLNYI